MIAFAVLLLSEMAVFRGLNTRESERYADYAASAERQYGRVFLFIFCENLKTATLKYLLLELMPCTILLCILPHGIFEWHNILLSFALSIILSKEVTCFCLGLMGLDSPIPVPVPVHGFRDTVAMTAWC